MVIGRVIIRVTPFRALITLLITYLLSPLPLQVGSPIFVNPPYGPNMTKQNTLRFVYLGLHRTLIALDFEVTREEQADFYFILVPLRSRSSSIEH